MRIVLDTNVYISGLLVPEGNPGKILRLISGGQIQLLYSHEILTEIHRVLREKIKYTETDAKRAVQTFRVQGELIQTTSLIEVIVSDPTDNKILECALDGNADVIVSGDKKHLLSLVKFRGIPILSPADFLRHPFS